MQDQLNKLAEVRCNAILDNTMDNDDFDGSFVESMLEKLEDGKELTGKQLEAVNNIYESFGGE